MQSVFQLLSRLLYIFVTATLFGLAFTFIFYAGWSIHAAFTAAQNVLPTMLHAVSLVVIALAVSDLGKFLLEEQLDGARDLETTGQVRRTLTKFLTIIIIAASLHALVFMFEAGRLRIETLVYPSMLLLAVAVLVAVLGFYQRMAASVEHEYRADLSDKAARLDPEKEAIEREQGASAQ